MDIGSWERIGHTWKGVVALIAVCGLGFGAGSALNRFDGLPDRVDEMERDFSEFKSDYQADMRQLRLDIRSLHRDIQLSNCLDLAEKQGKDWQECTR